MNRVDSATTVTDGEIGAMLGRFAGPAAPVIQSRRQRHRRSRRAVALVAVAVLALVVSVPALALHEQIVQTVSHFLADKNEPDNAKQAIKNVSRGPLKALPLIRGGIQPKGSVELPYALTSVRQVVDANTPQGEIRLYELNFSNGYKGSAMVSLSTHDVGGASWGPEAACPSGWALRAGGSMVTFPGRTPLLVSGQVAEDVGSLVVVYPDGHTSAAVIGDGYFLAWVQPEAGASTDRTNFSPPVMLIARDNKGRELGHLRVRGDGDIPPSPGQPAQAIACGYHAG
jgi:hypothetical protein